MTKDNEADNALDRFGKKYKLWLVIPLLIAAVFALFDLRAGAIVLAMNVMLWIFLLALQVIQWLVMTIVPKSISNEVHEEVNGAIGITVFLGGCALTGAILRGDNMISEFATANIPLGVSLGFIDPIFAFVVLAIVWLRTTYKIYYKVN